MDELTHFSDAGRARMVDVSAKSDTQRVAIGSPQPNARSVIGMIAQPGLHPLAVGPFDLADEPGGDEIVVGSLRVDVHITRLRLRRFEAGRTLPSSHWRSAARVL